MNTCMIYLSKVLISIMAFFVSITDFFAEEGESILKGPNDNPFLYAFNAIFGLILFVVVVSIPIFGVGLMCFVIWELILLFPKITITILGVYVLFLICGYLSKIK